MIFYKTMTEDEKGKINKLNENLYSRTRYKDPLDKRGSLRSIEQPDVTENWQTPELDEILQYEHQPPKANPFMKKIFVVSLVFFFGAVALASFIFFGGSTFISSKNVDINILGPTVASTGEVLELGVSVSNTNNADLELAQLSVQYPQGARDPLDTARPLTFAQDDLGVIKAGAEAVRNVRVVLLGPVNEVKEIKFSVEYKVRGSNATFYKDKLYKIAIGDAPVTLDVKSPSSVTSGENFTTIVSVTLNSTEVLKNVVLKAEYPYGYSVVDSSPLAISSDNIWLLGDMSPGSEKEILIRGRLTGENADERTLRFYVGVAESPDTNPNPKIILSSVLNTMVIARPAIGLGLSFNGENLSTYIAPATRPISTTIAFKNNLPDRLLNPRLEVSLSGQALDESSITIRNNGLYDPRSRKIIWTVTNSLGNFELLPGDSGQVSLEFHSLPEASLPEGFKDIILTASMIGTPAGSFGQSPLSVTEKRTVRISSQVSFFSRALRSLGPFSNYGPLPLKVGDTTTYTISFSLSNTQGDLFDSKVSAKLGSSVSWLSAQNIAGEGVTYDSSTQILTWDLGELSSGSGFSSPPRELSVQISLTPSIIQIGSAPVLVDSIIFTGRDSISGKTVTINNPPLTTTLIEDPVFIQGDDIVGQ